MELLRLVIGEVLQLPKKVEIGKDATVENVLWASGMGYDPLKQDLCFANPDTGNFGLATLDYKISEGDVIIVCSKEFIESVSEEVSVGEVSTETSDNFRGAQTGD